MIDDQVSEDCLSSFRLDQLLAGELAPKIAVGARDHVAACARCSKRLAACEAERRAFVAEPPAPLPPPVVIDQRPPRPMRRQWLWLAAPALAACAVAVWLVRPRGADHPAGTRVKGAAHLEVFVAHAGQVRAGGPGEVVAAGDRLQFAYSATRAGYLAIASVDAAGVTSVYHDSAPFEPGEHVELGESVELDATLGDETIYAVFCARSLDATAALAQLRAPAASGCEVETLAISKRVPR